MRSTWDFQDPEESRKKFVALTELAASEEEKTIFRTQIARSLGLEKRFEEAQLVLDSIEDWKREQTLITQIYFLLEQGRVLNSSGQKVQALDFFEQAAKLDVPGLQLDAIHMIAIAQSSKTLSESVNRRGLERALSSSLEIDRRWAGAFFNNLGWDLHDQEKFEEALVVFKDGLDFRLEQGEAMPIHVAWWSVARCLRSLSRYDEALEIQTRLQQSEVKDNYVDEEIEELKKVLF